MYHPRPFQIEAVDRTIELLSAHRSVLGVAATGLGKTVIMTKLIQRLPGRVMFLAHREELIAQAARTIERATQTTVDIEMADSYAGESILTGKSHVVVSSIQTQVAGARGGRMHRFDPNEFSTVFVDEAHRSAADTYRRVISYYQRNPDLKLIGVTATPNRNDDRSLHDIYETVAFNYDIRYGIAEGYLVPIEQRQVFVQEIDLSRVRVTAGDLNSADVARVMEFEKPLHGVANATLEHTQNGELTLIFAASIVQGERLAEILNRHRPGCARFISGKTERTERRNILRAFAAREFQYLVNVDVTSEGYDNAEIEVVVIAKPTLSLTKYVQWVGRGTRPLPGTVDCLDMFGSSEMRIAAIARSRKSKCIVLDFVGVSGKHRLINTADVLAGHHGADVVARAKRMMLESPAVNTIEVLDEAAAQLARERARLVREMQEQREAREREQAAVRKPIVAQVKYTTELANPFSVLGLAPWEEKSINRGRPATDGQVKFLRSQGVDTGALSFTEASQLCVELRRRLNLGLCSWKQAQLLKKRGMDPNVTRTEAKRLIDEIAQREQWKPKPTPEQAPTPPPKIQIVRY